MRKNQNLFPYFILTVLYIITLLPIMYLTILLIGKADSVLVIFFGIINAVFLMRYFKRKVLLCLLLGFLISSFSLCFVYFIWLLGLFSKLFFGTVFFIIFSITLCLVITKNDLKIKNNKNIYLIVSLPMLIFLICSFNLKETYPTKFENEDITFAQIKIVDKQQNPKFGDSIEVRIYRQPLFGLRESHEIYKTTTNEKGIAKIRFSKSKNYELVIITKENKLNFFDINSSDLKKKNNFVIVE